MFTVKVKKGDFISRATKACLHYKSNTHIDSEVKLNIALTQKNLMNSMLSWDSSIELEQHYIDPQPSIDNYNKCNRTLNLIGMVTIQEGDEVNLTEDVYDLIYNYA